VRGFDYTKFNLIITGMSNKPVQSIQNMQEKYTTSLHSTVCKHEVDSMTERETYDRHD
jgi:hypothetical protein